MKLLCAPYGYPRGRGFVMYRRNQPLRVGTLRDLILACHCPAPQAEKAIACLVASGHFECRLNSEACTLVLNLRQEFIAAGIDFDLEPSAEAEAVMQEHVEACARDGIPIIHFTCYRQGIKVIEYGDRGIH